MSGPADSRLLIALHDPLLNGATIAVLRLVAPLESLGWRIAFWVPAPGPAYDWLKERGAQVEGAERPIASGLAGLRQPPGVAARLAASPAYLRSFARFVRRFGADVLHANSLYSFAEALTARALGVPTVIHLHDMAPSSWKAAPVRQMVNRGLNGAVAVSEACAASYETRTRAPLVVHGAAPLPSAVLPVRDHPKPFVVGNVGVVSRRKGTDIYVEAAEILGRRNLDVEFHMIGSPSDPLDREWGEEVIERAVRAGIRHQPSADVAEAMSGWDAFALPARRDPFPLVVMEAMAAGLPVIASDVDGISEQLAEGAGVLVRPDDATSLATAIEEIAGAPASRRHALGAAARKRVEERFTVERQARGMDAAYRKVLNDAA